VKLVRAKEVEAFPADSDGRRVGVLSPARMTLLSSLNDRRVRRLSPARMTSLSGLNDRKVSFLSPARMAFPRDLGRQKVESGLLCHKMHLSVAGPRDVDLGVAT
jgi:hypothetical protein